MGWGNATPMGDGKRALHRARVEVACEMEALRARAVRAEKLIHAWRSNCALCISPYAECPHHPKVPTC